MKIHLSAICGTAMASLAGLLREQGHEVTGSDQDVYPPMSTQLEQLGITLGQGYDPTHISADTDIVVVGNALRLTRGQRTAAESALAARPAATSAQS